MKQVESGDIEEVILRFSKQLAISHLNEEPESLQN